MGKIEFFDGRKKNGTFFFVVVAIDIHHHQSMESMFVSVSISLSNKDVIIIGIIFGLFFFLPQWHKSRYNDEWMWKSSMKKTMMINWPTVCPTECLGQRSNDDDGDQLYNAKQLDFFFDWKWNQKIKKQWWFGQTFFRCFFLIFFLLKVKNRSLFVCLLSLIEFEIIPPQIECLPTTFCCDRLAILLCVCVCVMIQFSLSEIINHFLHRFFSLIFDLWKKDVQISI